MEPSPVSIPTLLATPCPVNCVEAPMVFPLPKERAEPILRVLQGTALLLVSGRSELATEDNSVGRTPLLLVLRMDVNPVWVLMVLG